MNAMRTPARLSAGGRAAPPLKGWALQGRSCGLAGRQRHVVHSQLTLQDAASGVNWTTAHKFWEGEDMHCLGAATRLKKVMVVSIQVYSAALYVEAVRAAKELGVRQRGGFFSEDADYCAAVLDGAFNKVMLFRLVRDITGKQFADAVGGLLAERMALAGDSASLDAMISYFADKELADQTQVAFLWSLAGDLEILIIPPGTAGATPGDFTALKPDVRIRSPGLARSFFELFLGERDLVPGARPVWAAGAKDLLESEVVKREARKSG